MTSNGHKNENSKTFSFIFTFLAMYIFWLLNSGMLEVFYLSLGALCSLIVALVFHNYFALTKDMRSTIRTLVRLVEYLPWLIWQITLSNWDVIKRVLDPKMPIDPCIISFQSTLKKDLSITTLANSITLTPGTITIDAEPDGTFYVHSIAKEPAESLLSPQPCEMAVRSGYIFEEGRKWK